MKARTAGRLLAGIFGFMIVALALSSIGGDEDARATLRQVVVGALLVGGLFYMTQRFKVEPRRASFADRARAVGLASEAGDRLGFLDSGFELARRAASVRDVESTATGTRNGRDVAVLDYWYAVSSRTGVDDYVRFVCALLPVPSSWPWLLVVPERIATLVGDALLGSDPDTESEAFNRTFAVRTDDRRFASAFLDARTIAWLLERPTHTGFEIRDGRLLCFVARDDVRDDVAHAVRTAEDLVDRVPAPVRAWYG